MNCTDPEIKELIERRVAFVSFTGNYMGNTQIYKELFEKLGEWAGPRGLIGPDPFFAAAYQDDPEVTPPDELYLEICLGIPEGTTVDGDIQERILPGGRYAVMHCELASPAEYGEAWTKIVTWVRESGHPIDMSRPSYEIYLCCPEQHPEGHHVLDICMSVK